MECPRCGRAIQVPAAADRNFRAQCSGCGWGSAPAAVRPEVKTGLFGEERLSRARSVKYMAAALGFIFFPMLVWNVVAPVAFHHSLQVRNMLGGTPTPYTLQAYLAGVGIYLVAAFACRFEVTGEYDSMNRWDLQLWMLMLLLTPGRWFWMSLQGLALGKG